MTARTRTEAPGLVDVILPRWFVIGAWMILLAMIPSAAVFGRWQVKQAEKLTVLELRIESAEATSKALKDSLANDAKEIAALRTGQAVLLSRLDALLRK